MMRWQTLKQIPGEVDVYAYGKVVLIGEDIAMATCVGRVRVNYGKTSDSQMSLIREDVAWRIVVPSLRVSMLAVCVSESAATLLSGAMEDE